jgi:bla regulator protein blaR1
VKTASSFSFLAVGVFAAVLTAVPLPTTLGFGQATTNENNWEKAAGGKMEFEVASIHPSEPGKFTPPNFALSEADDYIVNTDSLTADFPLPVYIDFAYKIMPSREEQHVTYATLPNWVTTESLTIHAKAASATTKDQMRLMMQSLLADRFGLKTHFEMQPMPVLALRLIKPGSPGPTLRSADNKFPCDAPAPPLPATKDSKMPDRNGIPDGFPFVCNFMLMRKPGNPMLLGARYVSTAMIADALSGLSNMGRPIVDETGLTGRYDFTLQWTPEENSEVPGGASTTEEPAGPTFVNAVEEQLGMKLESTGAPVQILVIDHIEQPSPN